jgi:hypothetical protein
MGGNRLLTRDWLEQMNRNGFYAKIERFYRIKLNPKIYHLAISP